MKINNNELVMPKNYSVVNEEEMTYVDGGASVENKGWGYYVYFTHRESQLAYGAKNNVDFCARAGVPLQLSYALYIFKTAIKNNDKGSGVLVRMRGQGIAAYVISISAR